jgi:chromosome transmission fidelity protein 8
MPTITVHLPAPTRSSPGSSLPPLLQTPLGYALLELQGTINFPAPAGEDGEGSTEVARVVFPDYDPSSADAGTAEGPWMKRVWLYVGFQRMTGSVVRLAKPLALLRRREARGEEMHLDGAAGAQRTTEEELEILELVRWKIVFRSRPEPVGLTAD